MYRYDTVIKNGIFVDGLRNPRVRADVGIKDGLIADIGLLDANDAHRVLDANGLIVAPGFIDLHTHYDSQLFWDPHCSPSGWHGVTTVVVGNCGYGFAPCSVADRDRIMLTLSRTEGVPILAMKTGMPWDWVTFPEYIGSVSRAPKAVNVAINVPLNPLLVWVMGFNRAKAGVLPTDVEHREMVRLLNEAMDAGAIGFSAQRYGPATSGTFHADFDGTPLPTDLLHDETMLVLADALRNRNDGFIQYAYPDLAKIFYESGVKFGAPEQAHPHVEDLARRSGRSVVFFPSEVDTDTALEWAKACQEQGLPIYAHCLTNTILRRPRHLILPEDIAVLECSSVTWGRAVIGTLAEIKGKLTDSQVREALRRELTESVGVWSFVRGVSSSTNKYKGMSLREIASELGAESCVDAFLNVVIEDEFKDEWCLPLGGYELDLCRRLINYEYWLPGLSDGGAHTKFVTGAHYGTVFLMTYVREHKWLSLEDAHYKLSSLPARIVGLESNIGALVVGAPADIVVYDLAKLSITEPQKLYDFPANEWRIADRGIGYRWVLVNGEITIEDDRAGRKCPGRIVHTAKYHRNLVH